MNINAWIEAMRLRTIPVSVAGVIAGTACAIGQNGFNWIPAVICLVFAILAQIVSNFGNEYFDFKNGLDKKGRDGFRRGVTEGDISPKAMRNATFGLLAADCLVGLSLLYFGPWWLIFVGIAVALFAVAYSAGPYPLSHHGLGDIAVIIFFGIIPVTLTAFLQTQSRDVLSSALPISLSIGILAALVLIVNNYRDCNDDKNVGKNTTVVLFGRKFMAAAYISGAITAITIALCVLLSRVSLLISGIGILFYIPYIFLYKEMRRRDGAKLNPLLGLTAMTLLLFTIYLLIAFASIHQTHIS